MHTVAGVHAPRWSEVDQEEASRSRIFARMSFSSGVMLSSLRSRTDCGLSDDVDELPDTPEALLSTDTADGLTIRPLYTRRDELAEPGVPGRFPFVRGADPARDVTTGWRVTERFGDDATPAADLNELILEAMANGTSGLWLSVSRPGDGLGVADLATALRGVYLDLVPVTLDAGTEGIAAARELLGLKEKAQAAPVAAAPTAATVHSFGLSPLTATFSGRPTVSRSVSRSIRISVRSVCPL